MAVAYRDDSTAGGTGGSFTPTKPTGTTTNDLTIIHFGFEKGSDVVVGAVGQWTLIDREDNGSNIGHWIGWRLENGAAYTAITLTNTPKFQWTVMRLDGQDLTTPMDVAAISANGSSGNPDPGSIDPVTSDCMVVACVSAKTQTTYTAPSGYTEQYDNPNSGAGTPSNCGATKLLSGHAADNPGVFVAGSASEWVATTIAVRPAGAAAVYVPRYSAHDFGSVTI